MENKNTKSGRIPGVFLPWEEERKRIPQITGNEAIVREIWENTDHLAWTFIWQILVSF
ncbi:hypothetical protein [Atribacter laminatus]|jgi:hypothetical protein|uniref:Uncharacterized protein n=1 Tax=Atribacter laminatus TaxID=2847778 RepID=A0A7T1AKI9_ATRLM|nr:hypothetical protein [Atribacter laminatus]QPM67610.1 hypothetical protein RT761_00814 [Atribacter laminatus]